MENKEYRKENIENRKIRSFKDLGAWNEGHKLVLMVYRMTKKFPKEELFGLTNQIRRAAVSITSNLAEGFGRSSAKEKHQFYSIARGSITEVQNQLQIARDVDYISDAEFRDSDSQAALVHKIVTALAKSTRLLPIFFILLSIGYPNYSHAATLSRPGNNLGLVGYWSFNEGAGSIVHDFSGNHLDTALSGTTQWISGKLSKALSFDGSTGYFQNTSTKLALTSDLTISIWIDPSNWNDVTNASKNPILEGRTGGGVGPYALYASPTQIFFQQHQTSGGDVNHWFSATASTAVPSNTWTLVTITRSGSTIVIYKNGVQVATGTADGPIDTTYSGFRVGKGQYDTTYFWIGSLDELRMYNRALSATEVAALYQAGATRIAQPQNPGTLSQGLIGWWTLDGADIGTTIVDRSGSGFNGYLVGTNNATSARETIGKIGQAFSFGGQNTGGISLGSSSSLDPNRFTIAGWIYVNTPQTYAYNYIYSNARDCCGTYNGIDFKVTAPGFLNGIIWNSSAYSINSSSLIATSTWTFVAFSYDGANKKLYINGKLSNSTAQTVDPGTPASFNTYLGSMGNANGATFTLNGKLDDMRLYNRALSASEIQLLYDTGAGTHMNSSGVTRDDGSSLSSGLIGYWTFDGGTMTTNVADKSGQGNNGFLSGVSATSSVLTIGKLGQALRLNGSDQVNVGSLAGESTSALTYSYWYKEPVGLSFPGASTNEQGFVRSWSPWNALGIYSSAVRFTIDANNSATDLDSVGFNPNGDHNWHMVTGTWDGATMKLYIDGAFNTSVAKSGTLTTGGQNPIIGDSTDGAHHFNGILDDIRVYNRALSASEVQQLYNMGK